MIFRFLFFLCIGSSSSLPVRFIPSSTSWLFAALRLGVCGVRRESQAFPAAAFLQPQA